MESETIDDLKAQITRLQDERDIWKDKARRQAGAQPLIDEPNLKTDEIPVDHERSKTEIIVDDGDTEDKKEATARNGVEFNLENHASTSQPDKAAPAQILQPHENVAEAIGSSRSSHTSSTGEEALISGGDNIHSPGGAEDASGSDTYGFIEDFPNGQWWTSVDEDDVLARSLDFGANGFTASLNMGHEILQITAPHPRFGFAYVRGSYADNADAIIARAQRTVGGKSTFGLKWSGEGPTSYRRGPVEYHGLLNFRWPYKRHSLYSLDTLKGTVCSFTFVKDGIVYQILRFEPGNHLPPPPPPPHLPMSVPISTPFQPDNQPRSPITIKLGGIMKTHPFSSPDLDTQYAVESKEKAISCHILQQGLRLNFELFLNGQKQTLSLASPVPSHGTELRIILEKSVMLEPGTPTVVVSRISLQPESESPFTMPLPSDEELVEYLGASDTSENATDRVWGSRIDLNTDIDSDDFFTSAACLEQILGVTSLPMRQYWKPRPQRPSSTHPSMISTSQYAEVVPAIETSSQNEQATVVDPSKRFGDSEAGSLTNGGLDDPEIPEKVDGGYTRTRQEQAVDDEPIISSANSHASAKENLPREDSALIVFAPTAIPSEPETAPLRDQEATEERIKSSIAESEITSPMKEEQVPSSGALRGDETASTKQPPTPISLPHPPPPPPPPPLVVETLSMEHPDMGIALLCGILGNQYVDTQSSFWQIRYLVKAHNFLTIRGSSNSEKSIALERSNSSLDETISLERVRTSYLKRIKFHIHHSLVWLARARLLEGYHVWPAVPPYCDRGSHSQVQDYDNDRTLYPPLAIWYVMKNCPDALPPSFMNTLTDSMQDLMTQEIREIDVTSSDHAPKIAILLWYRHACFAKISQHLLNVREFRDAPIDPKLGMTMAKFLEEKIVEFHSEARLWRKKAEKSMATSRRAAVDSYSDEDESADRLAFLGVELGITDEGDSKVPSTCLAQTRRRILDRRPTLFLNPGAALFGQGESIKFSTTAPWELTCLNHQIRLQLWRDPDLEDGLHLARKDCMRFVSVNYLFLGWWDTSNGSVANTFWGLTASCMVCATFLDMRSINEVSALRLDPATAESPGLNPVDKSRRRPSISYATELRNDRLIGEVARLTVEPHAKRDLLDESIVDLLRRQLEKQDILIQTLTKQGDNAFAFDWTRCEPPKPFHPDAWIQSLDDTPELYRTAHTRTIHLRTDLERYLNVSRDSADDEDGSILGTPDWTMENVSEGFGINELAFLSIYDIGLSNDDYYAQHVLGRLEPSKNVKVDNQTRMWFEFSIFFKPGNQEINLGLWAAYLDGHLDDDGAEYQKLPDSLKQRYREIGPWIRKSIAEKSVLMAAKAQLHEKLLERLNDSLVDCDVHNRIFFVQRCSRSIVKAFIYMWHRQSIDTFDNHFRNASNFLDTKTDTWISSITLSYWGFKARSTTTQDLFDEPRDTAPFPPKMVSRWHRFKAAKGSKKEAKDGLSGNPAKYIVEGSSSIVISGDTPGRWWTCSIISSVLPEAVMRKTLDNSTITMTEFIHQPSSGRCLVFLSFLGVLCEYLALEYEAILEELTRAINLGREVLKKGLDWTHAEDAIQRLKSMLWALEALRIFDDPLRESLDTVKEARDKMGTYLSQGPGRRHEQLERQCQILLEEFDKQHGRLIAVHVKIEQKINQISRYREGISAVSNLEDTHTALKQNDTIRILTYITIAYLPLSFIAAVFSMSIVTDSNWGPNLFGGLVIIFFISTLVLAKSLGLIIRSWDGVVKLTRTKLGMHDPLDLDDILDQAEQEVQRDKDEPESESGKATGSPKPVHEKGPMALVRKLRQRRRRVSSKDAVAKDIP